MKKKKEYWEQAEEMRRMEKEKCAALERGNPYIIIDRKLKLKDFNTAFVVALGYKRRDIKRGGLKLFVGQEGDGDIFKFKEIFLREIREDYKIYDLHFRHKNGLPRSFDAVAEILSGGRVMLILIDLNRLVFDSIAPAILNRRYFILFAEVELKLARRLKKTVTFFLFDVNKLKSINDTFGHCMGDRVIDVVKESLICAFPRETELKGRIGGDEFVVMVIDGELPPSKRIEKFRKALNGMMGEVTSGRFLIEVSVGYSVVDYGQRNDKDTSSLDDLIKAADAAMYEDKKASKELVLQVE